MIGLERVGRARRSWRTRTATAVVVLLTLASALAAGVAPAHAYVIEGQPWPGHVITYHNDLRADAAAVAAAVHDWNTSGASVRFVAAPASRAEVTISQMPAPSSPGSSSTGSTVGADVLGYATVGMVPREAAVASPSGASGPHGAHVWLLRIGSHDAYGLPVSLSLMKRVAAHELGHVLGLGHETHACAVMEPALNEGCGIRHAWMGLCPDPLQSDDVRGAVALYGGREPRGGRRLCSISPRPSAPRAASARRKRGDPQAVVVSWTDPPGIALDSDAFDPYSLAGRPTIASYELDGSRNGCPRPGRGLLLRNSARPGKQMRVSLPLEPGNWCLRVRIGDAFERWGRSASVRVHIPAFATTMPVPAGFTTEPAEPVAGASVLFSFQPSPGSPSITSWSWSFGDGTSSTQQSPQHTYVAAGVYTVTVAVTDADGDADSVSQQVVVSS